MNRKEIMLHGMEIIDKYADTEWKLQQKITDDKKLLKVKKMKIEKVRNDMKESFKNVVRKEM